MPCTACEGQLQYGLLLHVRKVCACNANRLMTCAACLASDRVILCHCFVEVCRTGEPRRAHNSTGSLDVAAWSLDCTQPQLQREKMTSASCCTGYGCKSMTGPLPQAMPITPVRQAFVSTALQSCSFLKCAAACDFLYGLVARQVG